MKFYFQLFFSLSKDNSNDDCITFCRLEIISILNYKSNCSEYKMHFSSFSLPKIITRGDESHPSPSDAVINRNEGSRIIQVDKQSSNSGHAEIFS